MRGGWREEGASILDRWSTNVLNRASSPMVVLSLYANLFIGILGGHMQKLPLKLNLTNEVLAYEIYNMLKCFRKTNRCVLCKKLQGQQ